MLEYDILDVPKGIDFSRINGSRECSICQYWYFLIVNFRIQTIVCDDCLDSIQKTQKSASFIYVAIAYVKENDCGIYFL